jgi:hypothetical protein
VIGSHKKMKSTQHWFGPMQVRHRVYKRGLNGPSVLSFHINSLNIYTSSIFYISWSAYFAGNFAGNNWKWNQSQTDLFTSCRRQWFIRNQNLANFKFWKIYKAKYPTQVFIRWAASQILNFFFFLQWAILIAPSHKKTGI